MERQLRNMGGLMTLEEPRQGYFLGKIVRKAKKAIKKVVKSPLGKAAILGGIGMIPFGASKASLFSRLGGALGTGGKLSTLGDIFRVGGEAGKAFSVPRILGGIGIGSALAAPFLMGGDEEEEDPGIPVSGVQPMVADIRNQAQQFYRDPAAAAASGLFFMPQRRFVQEPFLAAGGGLADIPRGGYESGEMVMEDLSKDPNYKGWLKLYEKNPEVAMMNEKAKEYLRFKNSKAGGGLADIPREGYESGEKVSGILKLLSRLTPAGAAKELASNMDMDTLKKLSMLTPFGAAKKAAEGLASMDMDILKKLSMLTPTGAAFNLGKKLAMKDGGMIDMGGLEKDYREGGFVPIGAEERADDVPARLSKNEFVFTADAVRNAGGGDIDKGAEVMQNMMDNLEAGGTISEESQGKENPAQAMFDQAQMLENRIV